MNATASCALSVHLIFFACDTDIQAAAKPTSNPG